MIRAARSLPVLLSTAFLVAFAAGCHGHDDIGKPCDNAEQCAEGQVCDFHDGKGTCQEPHGHGSEGETHSTDDHATDHEHATDDEHTSTGGDPTETTSTTGHEHGETEHEHTSTGDTSTG
ncbi:hypothetical protein [Nannocystis pusilla]|uniref:Lipoprotein n=1 Tax=Nannocystis pusilla TaxID=889268 RepID=A0ABS7TJF3_9BACT|nr:hypothetical protein [Nannocystis pusilla]MBZ5708355.1 hypothetical protein [Nannocystis pusilla]